MLQCFGITLSDEIVQCLRITFGDCFRYHPSGLGFGFRRTFTCFSFPECCFFLTFSAQNLCALLSFRDSNGRGTFTFSCKDRSALFSFGLHLVAHRFNQVSRG